MQGGVYDTGVWGSSWPGPRTEDLDPHCTKTGLGGEQGEDRDCFQVDLAMRARCTGLQSLLSGLFAECDTTAVLQAELMRP